MKPPSQILRPCPLFFKIQQQETFFPKSSTGKKAKGSTTFIIAQTKLWRKYYQQWLSLYVYYWRNDNNNNCTLYNIPQCWLCEGHLSALSCQNVYKCYTLNTAAYSEASHILRLHFAENKSLKTKWSENHQKYSKVHLFLLQFIQVLFFQQYLNNKMKT